MIYVQKVYENYGLPEILPKNKIAPCNVCTNYIVSFKQNSRIAQLDP